MDHRNNFDLLRLLAASQVLFVHAGFWLKLPVAGFSFLYFLPGVPIFFMISGFLVIDSAMRSDTGLFFWKRALRIYPALWLNLFAIEIAAYFSGDLLGIRSPLKYAVMMLVTAFTASLDMGFHVSNLPVPMYTWFAGLPHGFLVTYPSGVLWTLTIELSFYLLAPAFAAVALYNRKIVLALFALVFAASAVLASFWTTEVAKAHSVLDVLCPAYLWIFTIGMAARVFWDKISWLLEGKAIFWVTLYFAISFTGVNYGWTGGLDFHYSTNLTLVARMVLLGCAVLSTAFTFRNAASILRSNDISYGVYLWHMPVVVTLMSLGMTGQWWAWPLVVVATIVLAATSWLLVEQPSLRVKDYLRSMNYSTSPAE